VFHLRGFVILMCVCVPSQEKQTAAEEKRKEKRAKSFIAPVETANKSNKKQQKGDCSCCFVCGSSRVSENGQTEGRA